MSERIDHALHAERLLTRTRSNISGEPMPTAEDVNRATAFALLALVEQQRIANLITIAGWVIDAGKDDVRHDLNALSVGQADAVWEALGLS